MHPVKTFHVRPALPKRLQALDELAYNLRWSWDHDTINLFRRLDRSLWEADAVHAHPLTNTATVILAHADLEVFLRATKHVPCVIDVPAAA